MVLLGGLQTLTGPIVGASVFAVLQDTVMRSTEYWRALLGIEAVLRELKRVAEQEDVAQSTKVRALELIAKHLGMLEDRVTLKTDGLSSEQRAERVAILLERVRSRD